ncbi:thiamine pyrophosphate-binding protein [Blastococcus sp. SYSU DS0619]
MKFHAQLAEALLRHDIGALYGLIGDGNLFFVDHFVRELGGRYIPAVHEANAVMMAAGHARVTGRVGVATVTHGPGLANTVTALIEAVKSRIPLVLLAGDTSRLETWGPQNVDQQPLVLATGAGFEVVRSPLTLEADLETALRRAWSERRPIVLNMPIEYMWVDVEPSPARPPLALTRPRTAPDPEALDAAVGIILSANRPIVLAGQGALDARDELVELARAIGAPLATTMQAKDLFAGEPANLGIFGSLSTIAAQEIIAESDCVIAFGASLNPKTTYDGELLTGKALVHCDAEPASIDRFVGVSASVLGDAALTARTITEWLREADVTTTRFDGERTTSRLVPPSRRGTPGRPGTVDAQTALLHLDEALPDDHAVVCDVGRFALYALRVMEAPDARSWLCSGAGFAAIGMGMGMAIGSCVARPDRPTVLVVGDGSFMLGGLNELTTAVQQGLDLVCIVCNDGSYGAEHIQFVNRDLDPSLSDFDWPDFAGTAEALGARGVTVTSEEELGRIDDALRDRDRPVLIDLRLDPYRVTSLE